MKLKLEVIGVDASGDLLTLHLQGSAPNSPDWRTMGGHKIQIDNTPRNCKAFYLGRILNVTIEPK